MNHAFKEWIERFKIGDKLPRGKYFNSRQLAMVSLTHHLRGSHEFTHYHLDDAFGHYLDITGSDPSRKYHTTPPDDLEEDKITYSHLIKKNPTGRPVFDADDCVHFMVENWGHDLDTAKAYVSLHLLC